jgi:hypothetical protein
MLYYISKELYLFLFFAYDPFSVSENIGLASNFMVIDEREMVCEKEVMV